MNSRSFPLLVTFGPGVSPTKVKRSTVKTVTRNISKTVTDMRLEPREHLYVGPTRFRLAPLDLTLDDLWGSKINAKDWKTLVTHIWNIVLNEEYECTTLSLSSGFALLLCHRLFSFFLMYKLNVVNSATVHDRTTVQSQHGEYVTELNIPHFSIKSLYNNKSTKYRG